MIVVVIWLVLCNDVCDFEERYMSYDWNMVVFVKWCKKMKSNYVKGNMIMWKENSKFKFKDHIPKKERDMLVMSNERDDDYDCLSNWIFFKM